MTKDLQSGLSGVEAKVTKRNPVMELDCEKFLSAFRHAPEGTAILLDVRNDDEVTSGRLEGSIPIPLPQLGARAHELPKDKNIFVYCRSGGRAASAKEVLIAAGFPQVIVATGGGYEQLSKP